MADTVTRTQLLLARGVVGAAVLLVAFGLFRYGFSTEVLGRIGRNIAERPGGSMAFRFILQPVMAAVAALHDGARDARLGRSPYLWTILTKRSEDAPSLRDGVIATARIILLGLVMDAIYQVVVLDTFYPAEIVIVAVLLAFIPYVLLRGPFCRLARWWFAHQSSRPTA